MECVVLPATAVYTQPAHTKGLASIGATWRARAWAHDGFSGYRGAKQVFG